MFCFVGRSLLWFKYNEMVNIQQGLGCCDKTQRGGCQVLVGDVEQTNEAKKSFPSVDVGDKCDKSQLYLK